MPKTPARCNTALRTTLVALLATLLWPACGTGWAQQQGGAAPRLMTPRGRGQGSTVLEIPANRGQAGEESNGAGLVPQPGQELEIPSRQLRSQAGYGQTTVTVIDPSGRYVTGLAKDDFKLYENGEQRPIVFFRRDLNTPVSIGILVDTSGSMQPKILQARAAIAQFLRDLNDRDDIFLFAFSDRPFLLQPFTSDHSLLMSRLGLLHAFGRTALYDVILEGLRTVSRGRFDKKALLVVTDGMDTASAASVEQVVQQARSWGVLVYSIGIGNPNATALSAFSFALGPFGLGSGADQDRVDAETLQTLSTETGAKTFIISEVGDGELLRQATAAISRELREQYTVGFLSPNPERTGYRSLRVEVPTRRDVEVRVRKGVTVGERPESASADPASATP